MNGYNKIRSRNKKFRLCHAPFSTIFLTEYGEILPCYYNKSIVFGNIKSTSIAGAWFGEEMNNLRNHIKNNDLSYGCQDCKAYIESENFYSAGAWKYEYLPVNKSKYPISIDFQISNICNLACIMCNGEYSLTVRQYREKNIPFANPYDETLIEKIAPFLGHLKEAAFTGGEVFLINLYYKIWDKILLVNPKIKLSVTTNGTILNTRVKKYLEKLDFNITVSLDSVNKADFETIRRNSDFDVFLRNFEYFHEYTQKRGTLFTVKICPMRQNWKEIPEIADFLNRRKISFLFNNVVFPPYSSLWNLPSGELNNIACHLESYGFHPESEIVRSNVNRVKNLARQIRNWQNSAEECERMYPDIDTKDPEELATMLAEKIKAYLTENKYISTLTEQKLTIEQIIDILKKEITGMNILKNALLYYFRMPAHRIISELNIRNINQIIDRTNQAGLTNPPA